MDEINKTSKQLRDGEPCGHPGCLAHISHPCEVCGRIGGRMDEIDKKIEEYCQIIEKKAVTIYGEDDDPFGSVLDDRNTLVRIGRQLIEQLKECREELKQQDSKIRDRDWLLEEWLATPFFETKAEWEKWVNWFREEVEQVVENAKPLTIEQRTKEACFKAGWDWIIRMLGIYPKRDEEDFKQAIDEAKIEG